MEEQRIFNPRVAFFAAQVTVDTVQGIPFFFKVANLSPSFTTLPKLLRATGSFATPWS